MIRSIKDIAEQFGCNFIYLFGSQADKGEKYLKGEEIAPETTSDLDIAIAFENPLLDSLKIYGNLYKDFSEIFNPFEIDLIFMHEVDTLLQYVKSLKE
jgi:predicted nucleotidyltransferase